MRMTLSCIITNAFAVKDTEVIFPILSATYCNSLSTPTQNDNSLEWSGMEKWCSEMVYTHTHLCTAFQQQQKRVARKMVYRAIVNSVPSPERTHSPKKQVGHQQTTTGRDTALR